MTGTVADVVLGQLPAWTVRQVVGCSGGDGVNGASLSAAGECRIVW